MENPPPIYTLMVELAGWSFDRTAGFPKSQRFTFGQRIDNGVLDGLMGIVRAVFSTGRARRKELADLNLLLEQLRVLWRLAQQRRWISQQQLLFVNAKIDEIGRMAGGWLKQTAGQ